MLGTGSGLRGVSCRLTVQVLRRRVRSPLIHEPHHELANCRHQAWQAAAWRRHCCMSKERPQLVELVAEPLLAMN